MLKIVNVKNFDKSHQHVMHTKSQVRWQVTTEQETAGILDLYFRSWPEHLLGDVAA
jgi:hypothetical protein